MYGNSLSDLPALANINVLNGLADTQRFESAASPTATGCVKPASQLDSAHSMQETQPSTSVPSSAICRSRM